MSSSSTNAGCALLACGTFLGLLVGGIPGAFAGGIVGLIVGKLVSSGERNGVPETDSQNREYKTESPRIRKSSLKRYSIRWCSTAENITHSSTKLELQGPLYIAENSDNFSFNLEPSAIDLALPARKSSYNHDLGYWPSYASIAPSQRYTYLRWLSSGRSEVPPGLGYIFIYFYGLERRVLIDKNDYDFALTEAHRLLTTFSKSFPSRSFKKYFSQFLHFVAYKGGTDVYEKWLPILGNNSLIGFDRSTISLTLDHYFKQRKPLPADIAYVVAANDPRTTNSVVRKRDPEKFYELFKSFYESKTGEGLILRASKRKTRFSYNPASMYDFNDYNALTTEIENVEGITSQFKVLVEIWQVCINELKAYSSVLRKQQSSGSINEYEIYQSLPSNLRNSRQHPLQHDWNTLLNSAEREDDITISSFGSLAMLVGIEERRNLTATHYKKISSLVQSFGYNVLPNPKEIGGSIKWEQEAALVKLSADQLSSELHGFILLLYLVASVAAADGEIDDIEFEAFNEYSDMGSLGLGEQLKLRAIEALLKRDPKQASSATTRICKRITSNEAKKVTHVLVRVAMADGVITPEERKLLSRVYKYTGLSEDDLFQELEAFTEHSIVNAEEGARGERIPTSPSSAKRGLNLDMSKVEGIVTETREVTSILSTIFIDEESDEEVRSYNSSDSEVAPAKIFPNLDSRFQRAAETLFSRDTWTWREFTQIAESNHLIPDSLFDDLNMWSDEELGDFILEKEGDVRVFTNMLEELSNA